MPNLKLRKRPGLIVLEAVLGAIALTALFLAYPDIAEKIGISMAILAHKFVESEEKQKADPAPEGD